MTCALLTIGTASKSKFGERFADRQSCFGQVTLDAAATAIGDLVLGERRQEASGRPTFLVGLLGELGPHQFDGGQAQVGEQQLDARSVDRIGRLHATPPSRTRSVVRRTNSGQLVVGGERHKLDGNIRDYCTIWLEAVAQPIEIRQDADIKIGVDRLREIGFTGAGVKQSHRPRPRL